jgi:hypothetical protein
MLGSTLGTLVPYRTGGENEFRAVEMGRGLIIWTLRSPMANFHRATVAAKTEGTTLEPYFLECLADFLRCADEENYAWTYIERKHLKQ